MQKKFVGQLSRKVLVYGFYFKNNLGDNLFVDAFKKLFPYLEFTFTNEITKKQFEETAAIFIGGGSLLDGRIQTQISIDDLKSKNIFYIGVGPETNLHKDHSALLPFAKLVAVRSDVNFDKLKQLNNNTIVIPDIVYSLAKNTRTYEKTKSILIIPNILVVPSYADAHWKHVSWTRFKCEFSQFLDVKVSEGYKINFLPMSNNKSANDNFAAVEIINAMTRRGDYLLDYNFTNINDLIKLLSSYDMIISQRYHGTILAEISRTPCMTLHHHDKLKKSYLNEAEFLSYYETAKQTFINTFNNFNKTFEPINENIFDELKEYINKLF